MEFTKENWENAPEGARLEYEGLTGWKPVTLIGFSTHGRPIVEDAKDYVWACANSDLRIILPKRKVTVQLWRCSETGSLHSTVNAECIPGSWNEVGAHTFEIEGE